MLRRITAVVPVCLMMLAACSPSGRLENPFEKKKPFEATEVPADFAIVVDENHDTYYARQHVQQVITAADTMSRTTYATYRDYNDSVARKFSQETPLNQQQLQAMWNQVQEKELMLGSTLWINWASEADLYKRNVYTVQVRANGKTKTFRETQGFPGQTRPLVLLIQAVRLPIGQDGGVKVVGEEKDVVPPPTTGPAMPAGTEPATRSAN